MPIGYYMDPEGPDAPKRILNGQEVIDYRPLPPVKLPKGF